VRSCSIETSAYSDKGTKIRIAFELLSALCHLHDNSIIHRDVKPDNIMMDENDRPILIDFSLCKVLKPQETATAETHTGNIGTACYISPECYNSVPYSYEADSYSVGVVLLELFKGTLLTDTVGRDKAALVAVQNMVSRERIAVTTYNRSPAIPPPNSALAGQGPPGQPFPRCH